MPDFTSKWSAAPDWTQASLDGDGWRASIVQGLSQIMISGAIDVAKDRPGGAFPEIGLWEVAATNKPYRLRIGRDRAILVSSERLDLVEGWHSGGWAASSVDDAWIVMDIEGAEMVPVIAELTGADLDAGSPSAAVRIGATATALLYRSREKTARLHIDGALAPWLWRWLGTRRS